ncbi:DUF429 domain-containing protein [Nordella sp. HKS 07]|uniref:DUF429 domain-containing protein n=1 Tax=Nordella sp. HKS 07 TaxID=2712222 RepID=UPI00352DDE12
MRDLVAGIDGCPAGWIAVMWDGGASISSRLCARFSDVMALPATIIAVDMPIGLPQRSGRPPERAVRSRLGGRQSSVFAVPSEIAVYCEDYAQACRVNLPIPIRRRRCQSNVSISSPRCAKSMR